jgi:tyrosyl-tRNA synthetase
MLTFVPLEELEQHVEHSQNQDKPDSKRELQKLLAKEVTLLVHGGEQTKRRFKEARSHANVTIFLLTRL